MRISSLRRWNKIYSYAWKSKSHELSRGKDPEQISTIWISFKPRFQLEISLFSSVYHYASQSCTRLQRTIAKSICTVSFQSFSPFEQNCSSDRKKFDLSINSLKKLQLLDRKSNVGSKNAHPFPLCLYIYIYTRDGIKWWRVGSLLAMNRGASRS